MCLRACVCVYIYNNIYMSVCLLEDGGSGKGAGARTRFPSVFPAAEPCQRDDSGEERRRGASARPGRAAGPPVASALELSITPHFPTRHCCLGTCCCYRRNGNLFPRRAPSLCPESGCRCPRCGKGDRVGVSTPGGSVLAHTIQVSWHHRPPPRWLPWTRLGTGNGRLFARRGLKGLPGRGRRDPGTSLWSPLNTIHYLNLKSQWESKQPSTRVPAPAEGGCAGCGAAFGAGCVSGQGVCQGRVCVRAGCVSGWAHAAPPPAAETRTLMRMSRPAPRIPGGSWARPLAGHHCWALPPSPARAQCSREEHPA
ncbi:PREDICTED: uncharacterized protein LOC106887058 isoform X2 [Calidris pugnax]|uniref:uncharacterized protein LOC106887058 isoform X2 n=1 Tax=Calidris pugnax TaxID=198806 RepID=UPI00071D28F6|nr:PREDICTED: uncharacterized protein LOC106887058 isoform X2 [Calidris pugnax]